MTKEKRIFDLTKEEDANTIWECVGENQAYNKGVETFAYGVMAGERRTALEWAKRLVVAPWIFPEGYFRLVETQPACDHLVGFAVDNDFCYASYQADKTFDFSYCPLCGEKL